MKIKLRLKHTQETTVIVIPLNDMHVLKLMCKWVHKSLIEPTSKIVFNFPTRTP